MDHIIYLILTLSYLILFLFGFRIAKRDGWLSMGNIVLLVILALAYDNGILAFGRYIGEGELLRILNEARYWLHALITPLLVLLAWYFLIRAKVDWARKRIVKWLFLAFTLGLIIIEFVTVIRNISLEPTWEYNVLSYDNVGDSSPIMIIGVSLTLLLTSIIIWWKEKWPWYFVGIAIMGIIPTLHLFETETIGNIGELILMVALLATWAFLAKRREG
jgi:hypothetical protein